MNCFLRIIKIINKDYSNFTMVLISTIGMFFLFDQLFELKRQNNYLYDSLLLSYRPFLSVKKPHGTDITTFTVGKRVDGNFDFIFDASIMNKGKGPSFLLGHLHYLSLEPVDFRSLFLDAKIDSTNIFFDMRYDYVRAAPIMPDEDLLLHLPYFNVVSSKEYYFYSMFIYKDLSDNIYDTINLTVLRYSSNFQYEMKDPSMLMNEDYNQYTNIEKVRLKKILAKLHPLMARLL